MRTFAIVFTCFAVLSACGKGGGGDDDLGADGGTDPVDCTPGEPGCVVTGAAPHCSGASCSCDDPDYPVDCQDGSCWPEGTDCDLEDFQCDGIDYRCTEPDSTINCCGGTLVMCPPEAPYYCPDKGGCSADTANCGDTDACELVFEDCR